jgi:membrane-associated protease RseP (regulator of RpoE activity)
LSLVMTWRGPLAVTAEEISAKKTAGGGWKCTATRGVPKPAEGPDGIGSGIYFYADFSAEGKCTRAEIDDRNPRPICIGALFWPVSLPQDAYAKLGFARGGGLLTASVEPDSIAARAGLQAGDTIIAFADKPLPVEDTIQQMRQVVYPLKQRGNAQRSLIVLRDGRQVRLTLRW